MERRAASRARTERDGLEHAGGRRRRSGVPVSERLHIYAYGDAELMWAEMLERWRADPRSSLVVSGDFAREHLLRQLGEQTLWGWQRVITLQELWVELARHLGDVPGELSGAEVEPLLAAEIEGLSELEPIAAHRGGLTALAEHLEWIEKQADADYAPKNALERDIAELRRRLQGRSRQLIFAWRSHIARRAKEIDLGRALHIAPLPELTRQLGGLLKGLARQNDVSAYLLTNETLLGNLLERIGVAAERVRHRPREQAAVQALFAGAEAQRPTRPEIELLYADDQIRTALERAAAWIAAGLPADRILICAPDPGRVAHEFAAHARELGIPAQVRTAVATADTRPSSLLAALAGAPDLFDLPESVLADAEELGVGAEDIEGLAEARRAGRGAELIALFEIGLRIAREGAGIPDYEAGRYHAWLDALATTVRTIREEGVEPWSVAELIAGTATKRIPRGEPDGVILASYAEAPALAAEGVVLVGLDAGELPRPRSRSAFTSEELLRACPMLRHADERPQFVAACAAAQSRLTLISSAGPESAPSPYFAEAKRAWGQREVDVAETTSVRLRARRAARRRRAIHPQIAQALERIARERLPQRISDPPGRRTYSVTELEQYLRCPYGWFVKHVLAPHEPPSPRAAIGSLAHELLAELIAEPLENVREIVAERMAALPGLGDAERRVHAERIERVLDAYAGEAWPFSEQRVEYPLRAEYETEEGEFAFSGRTDRIDLRDGEQGRELLVIDYKLTGAGSKGKWHLQPYLYPDMAAKDLAAKPLGFIYVSLRDGSATGWLNGSEPDLAAQLSAHGGQVSPDWSYRADAAFAAAEAAIAGIEAGEWAALGERGNGRCEDRWCPHHLLSDTGAER